VLEWEDCRCPQVLHLFPFDFFGMNRVQLQPLRSFCDPTQISGIGVKEDVESGERRTESGERRTENGEQRVRSGGRIRGRDGKPCGVEREETETEEQRRQREVLGRRARKTRRWGEKKKRCVQPSLEAGVKVTDRQRFVIRVPPPPYL